MKKLQEKKDFLSDFAVSKIYMHGKMLEEYSHIHKTLIEDIHQQDKIFEEKMNQKANGSR